jgi:hypothetical protein
MMFIVIRRVHRVYRQSRWACRVAICVWLVPQCDCADGRANVPRREEIWSRSSVVRRVVFDAVHLAAHFL